MRYCECTGCVELAMFRVDWPGKATEMCAYHAKGALATAMAMGFDLMMGPLKEPEPWVRARN